MTTKNLSILLDYTDSPINRRNADDMQVWGIEMDFLTVYHLTAPDNVESIKANGIKAYSSRQSYERPAAVYFFADSRDITPVNIDILGLSNGCRVLTVNIPIAEVIKHMVWDGLYNVSFGESYSAVQYLDDVPAAWIVA